MHPRYNGLTLGQDLAAEVRRLQAEVHVGISLTQISDQAAVIKAAINEFMVKFFTALGDVVVPRVGSSRFRFLCFSGHRSRRSPALRIGRRQKSGCLFSPKPPIAIA